MQEKIEALQPDRDGQAIPGADLSIGEASCQGQGEDQTSFEGSWEAVTRSSPSQAVQDLEKHLTDAEKMELMNMILSRKAAQEQTVSDINSEIQ